MKTLVVGIGNSLLQDDGIGLYVVEELEKRLKSDNVDFLICGADVLKIMNSFNSQNRVIIIDAVNSDMPAGSIICLKEKGLFAFEGFSRSAHQISAIEALNLMKVTVPEFKESEIYFIGIQIEDILLQNEISTNVKEAGDIVIKILEEILT